MSELEELKLAYAECSRQRNELLNKLKSQAQPEPWTPEDMAYRPGGLAQAEQDQTEIAFEAWWQAHGQYCRAGGGDYEKTFAYRAWMASLAIPEKPAHPEQMARLGWQYVECPACGSEGVKAFPKPEEQQSCDKQKSVAVVTGQYDFPMMQWRSVKHQMSTAIGSLLYTSPPQRQPLTHEQRLDLLTAFEKHKHEWNAESILIDMVEAAHGIGANT